MKCKRLLALLLLLCLLQAGCGAPAARETAAPGPEPADAAPTPEPTPTPTSEPAPTPEPDWPVGPAVTVDGHELASGSVLIDGLACAALDEYAAAAGFADARETGDGGFAFVWRGREVTLGEGDAALRYDGRTRPLDGPVARWHGRLWVPAESFSLALEIGFFDDGERQHLYCTPGAGAWALPEGYAVPVLMYHAVSDWAVGEPELSVRPADMEAQLQWLTDNGWDPIWFSDLEHVQDYDKPILLTFDDGYLNNYTELYPLLQRYGAKATFFVCPRFIEEEDTRFLHEAEIRELAASELVDIQSHSYSHYPDMSVLLEEHVLHQLADSQLYLTRMTGRQPFVFCYPCGNESSFVRELLVDYYRFGVKMGGDCYVTGADPTLVYRYYIKRFDGAARLEQLLGRIHG